MYKIILMRHGWSQWNEENRFTGWTDVDLHEKGLEEAKQAGEILKKNNISFDIVFTSVLKRAIKTTWTCLEKLDQMWVTIVPAWELNERHYGALQGLNKQETIKKHGEKQVLIWRRSFDIQPPALEKQEHDKRYPMKEPKTESLKDTIQRVLPFWEEKIVPEIKKNKKVFISAHGNSLRALIKHLDNMSEEEILKLTLPTAIPIVYELDENLKPIKHYYLGDEKLIQERLGNYK